MSQESAFVELILQNPDDDGPRMVFADWLEERGDCDRAEFIRVQCDLAKFSANHPQRPRLEARERQLLLDHRQEWEPKFDRPYVGGSLNFVFCRGFPEMHVELHSFPELEFQFVAGLPVPAVHLGRFPEDCDREIWNRFVECPFLDRVVGIEMQLSGEETRMLLQTPNLTRLRRLSLTCTDMTDRSARRLATYPAIASVREWQLHFVDDGPARGPMRRLGDRASIGIAKSRFVSNLRTLRLAGNRISNEGAIALAAAPHLSQLVHLDLGSNEISERGAMALAESSILENLEWLNLAYNFPGAKGEAALRDRFGNRVHLR